MKKLYILLMAIALIATVSPLPAQQTDIETYQSSRNEFFFNVKIDNLSEIETLTRMVSIDAVNGNILRCYANQNEFDRLKAAGYTPILIDNRATKASFPMWDGSGDYGFDRYLGYYDYVYLLENYVDNYPNCQLIDLGETVWHNIYCMRINNGNTVGKPKVMLTGAIHGNEFISTVSMMQIIDVLLTSEDETVQNLVNNLDIFILPMVNPDGTYPEDDEDVSGATRGNIDGVDLNRNFPDWVNGPHPDGYEYQNETQILMDLADQYQFTLAAFFHSGGAVVNYPWDCSTTNHADRNWWESVSAQYVSTARQGNSRYMRSANSNGDTPNGYIRGADWYVVYGGQQDYMNYYKNCRAVTIEIFSKGEIYAGETYGPTNTTYVKNIVDFNKNAILQYMQEALYGLNGCVYDAITGGRVEGATVTVNSHDVNGSEVVTDENGYYFRPIKAGNYSVTVSAPGYESQTFNVTAVDGQAVQNDITLEPSYNVFTADFTADVTSISLEDQVHFYDQSNGYEIEAWEWSFPGGTPATSTEQNPVVTYNVGGSHDVTLTVTKRFGESQTITKQNFITVNNNVLMHTGRKMVAGNINFYDTGGANGQYSANEDYTLTFYPSEEHTMVKAVFSSFATQRNADYLYVYNGSSTSAPSLGQFSNTTIPGPFTADNADGALTFRFTSNNRTNGNGWAAVISIEQEPIYTLAVNNSIANGTVTLSQAQAYKNDVITVTATPADGYQIESLYYVDASNHQVAIDTRTGEFTMPASNVTIGATFTEVIDVIVMAKNQTVTHEVGNAYFYDSGNENGNYSNRETSICTFLPDQNVEDGLIQIEFLSFVTESKYDKLAVYDGASTSAPLIGTYSGSVVPANILATNAAGAITVKFTSDASVAKAGWAARVSTFAYEHFPIVIDENIAYGTVAADKTSAFYGNVITLTATPADDDHFLAEWIVTSDGHEIEVVDNQFVMPNGAVNVSARFAEGIYHEACYQLVTSASELVPGETYIFASGDNGAISAMGAQKITSTFNGYTTYFNYYRLPVSVTAANGMIPLTDGVCEMVLGGTPGAYTFHDAVEDGYVFCYRYRGANGYTYALHTTANTNSKEWNVTIYNDGLAVVRNNAQLRDLGFASNKFNVFSITEGESVYIYKKTAAYWEEMDLSKGTTAVSDNVSIAASIYPNPTSGNVTIEVAGMNHISVFSITGQMLYDMDVDADNMQINLAEFGNGMYLVRIVTNEGIATERVIVE